jgi:hypothetical protein
MKKLLVLVLVLMTLLFSCDEQYTYIGQEVIDGKISAVREGSIGEIGHSPKIWVQTPTTTRELEIPFEYEGRWKVGDTCLLIIEKYKENK